MLRFQRNIIKRRVTYKRHFIGTQKSLIDNVKTMSNELKNKKDELIQMSTDAAIDNALSIIKTTEEKTSMLKIQNIDINVNIMLGPISITLSKCCNNSETKPDI